MAGVSTPRRGCRLPDCMPGRFRALQCLAAARDAAASRYETLPVDIFLYSMVLLLLVEEVLRFFYMLIYCLQATV